LADAVESFWGEEVRVISGVDEVGFEGEVRVLSEYVEEEVVGGGVCVRLGWLRVGAVVGGWCAYWAVGSEPCNARMYMGGVTIVCLSEGCGASRCVMVGPGREVECRFGLLVEVCERCTYVRVEFPGVVTCGCVCLKNIEV
jgi:hypothetical protein